MKVSISKALLPLTLLAAAGMLVWAFARQRNRIASPGIETINYQNADPALAMPASGKPDMRFALLNAWRREAIPVAQRFDTPLGSENGALVYNAQKFLEMNVARGGPHFGDDLNGIGGMNSDLGDPVFAAADGLVLYAAEPSNGWGNVMILAHRTADGRILHSMYAHLDRMLAGVGSTVARGEKIGEVGTAHGNYPAHLHFEMRLSDEIDIGPGYGDPHLNRIDPAATVASLRGTPADAPAQSPMALDRSAGEIPWSILETKDEKAAGRLLEIIDGKPGT